MIGPESEMNRDVQINEKGVPAVSEKVDKRTARRFQMTDAVAWLEDSVRFMKRVTGSVHRRQFIQMFDDVEFGGWEWNKDTMRMIYPRLHNTATEQEDSSEVLVGAGM